MSNNNLEKAKAVSKILEDSDMPQSVKTTAVLSTAMGVNPDAIVKGMANQLSAIETDKAEEEAPKIQLPEDYTFTEKIIHEMLVENTGVAMCDSGGVYGRAWQSNRGILDFRKNPEVKTTIWKDGDVELSVDVFHYLNCFLKADSDLAVQLNKQLDKFADSHEDLGWWGIAQEFTDSLKEDGWRIQHTFNSYNGESLLSQVIQGIWISSPDNEYGDDYPDYLILQIHGGADVRGGYTKPRVFEVQDFERMIFADHDIDASCGCQQLSSDDCGYNWQDDEGKDFDGGLPKSWKSQPKHKDAKNWEYDLVCSKCKLDVDFSARLDY